MASTLSEAQLRDCLLTVDSPWRHVVALETVDSTNAWSLRQLRPWQVVAAAEQTAGRGRRDRGWVSAPGTSIAMSFTVPMVPEPASWGWLPLLTGLAARDALAVVSGSEAFTLKWPNDVLAYERATGHWGKICGILCEAGASGLAVAGIGVNMSMSRAELPVPHATSLHLCGYDAAARQREQVVIALASAFARWHGHWLAGADGLERVRAAYRERCGTLGAPVRIHLGADQVIHGEALDVSATGEIVMQTTDGVRQFSAGDVVHLRPAGTPDGVGGTHGPGALDTSDT